MGFGDEIMGSGIARGASLRGEKIAFGDRGRILWSKHAATIFLGNQNIAKPGEEFKANGELKWIPHYPGKRLYNRLDHTKMRWVWNYGFQAQPGELFFTSHENRLAEASFSEKFILIEPNVPMWKKSAHNKMWHGYQEVANQLLQKGYQVVQFEYHGIRTLLRNVKYFRTPTIRAALACLSRAQLYIGPEGGMHHAAAALNIPAVVLFGGFIPPSVTGYSIHENLTGGVTTACGSFTHCKHCEQAMRNIKIDEVLDSAYRLLAR